MSDWRFGGHPRDAHAIPYVRKGESRRDVRTLIAAIAVFGALLSACGGSEATSASDDCFAKGWKECPAEPYPFTRPLPPVAATGIDGTYRRTIDEDLAWAPGKCRRCPPYRLEPGLETLEFDSGRFFITHHPPGFRSSGHFTLAGDRLTLFNDPSCIDMKGVYTWSIEDNKLRLIPVEDECPFTELRRRFLTAKDWTKASG